MTPAGAAGGLPAAPSAVEKIDSELQVQLEEDPKVDFWVRFEDRPDLSQFSGIRDWDARGQAVYDALTAAAEESQADVIDTLDQEGVAYRSFWITNAVRVTGGTEELALTLAGDSAVEGLYATRAYDIPDPKEAQPQDVGPAAVEWGIADVGAPEVWEQLGITGEGIVVGSIDTGVQYDHPALVNQYRGNNADGTFTHDYNWFDAAGVSRDVPVDSDGHGSHVTGTMVGDDGGDNRIGVAPGATWISANGCCPSDVALVSSGQWMLAPTRTDGSAPDPAMRPHIINNSWGTMAPSNDPFMEDISEAWAAAGQFGVWANGNNGPGCETSGSPGSRIINYSVGNYDAEHRISGSSSRGAGQDGEIKPNISAPGTAVRSSVPGNGYDSYTGTSMASPHVAGAVALLWSGAPALVGDVESTKALLDGSAIDTPDDQCGGTPEKNNVFGEGRLNALALLEAAPRGDLGYVEGTVTDAATGEPLPAAQVTITGEVNRTLRTNPEGQYRALVTAGAYQLSATKFGWVTGTANVTVPVDGTVTQDFALDQAPSGTLSGRVTDGSGQGYPLYAKVSVEGTPVSTFTDPADGSFSFDLPLDTPAQVRVEVQYPGYQVISEPMVLTGDTTRDIQVPVDVNTCSAYGYTLNTPGMTESFEDLALPAGWTVVNDSDGGIEWVFDDPNDYGNWTMGSGGFAMVENVDDSAPDASLITPVMDFSDVGSPALQFTHALVSNEIADVDLSLDGGDTWETVVSLPPDAGGYPLFQLPQAANQAEVQVRFRYHASGMGGWMWQVDEVYLGQRTCDPVGDGGYVFGNVYSGTTEQPIRGARVASVDRPWESGITSDTPADEGQDDGFYWLFSSEAGTQPFQASARRYTSVTQDVAVPAQGSVRADYTLVGGLITAEPGSIETTLELGQSSTHDLTLTNSGQAAADVEIKEVRGDFVMQKADGSRMATSKALSMAGAPKRTAKGEASVSVFPGKSKGRSSIQGPAEEPWIELTSFPVPIMDNRVVFFEESWYSIGGNDGMNVYDDVFRYDNESMEWQELNPLPEPLAQPTAAVAGGQLVVTGGWRSDGTTSAATYVYDAGADEWTEASDSPVSVSAAGQAVLDSTVYSVGGCTTGECDPMSTRVTAYDPGNDSWAELADYPIQIAFPACGGLDGKLVCTGGVSAGAGVSDTYVYDPGSDSWTEGVTAPTDWWGTSYAVANDMLVVSGGVQADMFTNETWAYDPSAEEWMDLPNPNTVGFRGAAACGFIRVGGAGDMGPETVVELLPGLDDCGDTGVDVPWLSVSQTEFTLEPGESQTVEVTTDANVAQPGVYTAGLRVVGGVPGTEPTVDVTMTVTPPAPWGKLTGLVEGEACTGDGRPLGGAAVDAKPTRMEQPRWRMVTDAEGRYARWIDTRVGQLELIASATGHLSESALITPPRGTVTEQDFALLNARCEAPPTPIHPDVTRLYGKDRYGTAAKVAATYQPGVDVVYLATGATFPDALAGAARAGGQGAPVLLTRPDSLPTDTRAELRRLKPGEVVVLGGTQAVSASVATAAGRTAQAPVRRIAGKDRYVTAALVAAEFGAADTVWVATGQDYPDALAAAARAGAEDAPVLLVRKDRIPTAAAAQLRRLSPDQIVVLGGDGVVSEATERALEAYAPVTRIAGSDRYETAGLLADVYPTIDGLYLASGQNWPDALTGAARAGLDEAPMLLTRKDGIPGSTWSALERLEPGWITVLGGPGAIEDSVLERLRTLE
ncbi:cell wall-binding repeat-containing protein [Ornithinimicrobium sp. Y1847]|uniref:cell wall-binding repeat-containing protein n=1 Tax=Ornithinimicrobium sp. Y1847 TaxID=3405419 RepID=UPI003B67042E